MTKTSKPKTEDKNKTKNSLISENSSIKIIIPWKQAEPAYKKTRAKLAKQIKIDGFRKGAVPAKIAEERIGQQQIIQETLQDLISPFYQEALKNSKKTPITYPEFAPISLEIGKDWELEAYFAELPKVKIDGYKTIVKKALKAGEKEIKDQGKKTETTKKEKKEDSKLPTLTEEQKKEIRLKHVFRELAVELKPKVPEMMLKHETQHEFENLSQQLKQFNMSTDDYLQRRKMSMEQLSNELAVSVLGRIQLDLILGEISKQEKLTVSKTDLDKHFANIKDEKLRKQMEADANYKAHLQTNLIKQKVVDFLLTLDK